MTDFERHVALITAEEPGNPNPRFTAWAEGQAGYKRRLRAERHGFEEPRGGFGVVAEFPRGCFGVVAEFPNEAPILMEATDTSYDAAGEHAEKLRGGRALRTCVVRLTYESGNELLLLDLERMQK